MEFQEYVAGVVGLLESRPVGRGVVFVSVEDQPPPPPVGRRPEESFLWFVVKGVPVRVRVWHPHGKKMFVIVRDSVVEAVRGRVGDLTRAELDMVEADHVSVGAASRPAHGARKLSALLAGFSLLVDTAVGKVEAARMSAAPVAAWMDAMVSAAGDAGVEVTVHAPEGVDPTVWVTVPSGETVRVRLCPGGRVFGDVTAPVGVLSRVAEFLDRTWRVVSSGR